MTLRHSTSDTKKGTATRQKREVHVPTVIQPTKGRTKMNKGYLRTAVVAGLAFLIVSLLAYPVYPRELVLADSYGATPIYQVRISLIFSCLTPQPPLRP